MQLINDILKSFGFINKSNLSKEGYVNKNVIHRYSQALFNRGFSAAKVDNLTSDWKTSANSIDTDIQQGLRPMRSRARNFLKNNDYVKSLKIQNRINTFGPNGILFQNNAMLPDGTPDKYTNDLIEDKWKEWGKKQYCTMSGQVSWLQLQYLYSDYMLHSGEFILRKIRPLKKSANKFGFSLELIEPEDLDESYSKDLGNGSIIVMGIEFNEWRRITAYHFKERTAKTDYVSLYYDNRKTIRIPAEDIIHDYDLEFIKQSRGYPGIASSMLRLNGVQGWEEASIYNARYAANNFAVLERTSPEGTSPEADDEDEDGAKVMESQIGDIPYLPMNTKLNYVDPKFPTDQHGPFLKTQLRAFAAASGVDYNSLVSDYESLNYSSLKSGKLSSQDYYRIKQNLFIQNIALEVFEEWLKYSLMTGEINLPLANYDQINKPKFKGRAWKQLEPYKEAQANKLMHDEGWMTETEIIAELGNDIEETFAKLNEENLLREQYGIKKPEAVNPNNQNSNNDNSDDNNTDNQDNIDNSADNQKSKLFKIG